MEDVDFGGKMQS